MLSVSYSWYTVLCYTPPLNIKSQQVIKPKQLFKNLHTGKLIKHTLANFMSKMALTSKCKKKDVDRFLNIPELQMV